MSQQLRRLQDEGAAVANDIERLSAELDAAEEARREELTAELELRMERAKAIPGEIDAERDAIEARAAAVSGLRSTLAESDPVSTRSSGPAIHVRQETPEREIEKAGRWLRQLARGEVRAMAENTVGSGKELVPVELYSQIINQMNRTSVGLRVASVFQTISNKITLPKAASATAAFYSEAAEGNLTDITTSGVDVTVFGIRSLMAASNDLIEDSVVDVANLFSRSVANAFASKIDYAWLQGDETADIDGLVDEVDNNVAVASAGATTAADLATMVGQIDPAAINTSWVVSPAGFGALLAAHADTGSVMLADAMAPTVYGRPVYVTTGLPAGTLALYGDFSMSTAVAIKASGLRVDALREVRSVNDQTLFVAKQRVGIANHDGSFVSKLIID